MELVKAPFEATLTGSRFFGNATDASDYDFFAPNYANIASWLKDHGWKIIIDESYTDQNSEAVYRRGRVDVALVKNFDLRLKVQDHLKLYFPSITAMQKEQRRQVWKYTYALLGL